ncbi:MAG: RNB domain-containing ribonuclease [Planctomycetes bacterium]|nr:RNB domain-containing ribonuclease [Planctomycetota bacterium]
MTTEPQPRSAFSADIRKRVLELASEPTSLEDLATQLGITDLDSFEDWLENLARRGFIQRVKRRRYKAPSGKVAVGFFRRGKHGAFVAPEDRTMGTIDIPPGAEEGAQDGDRVLVGWRREKPGRKGGIGGELVGKILNIVAARESEAVGLWEINKFGGGRVRLEGYHLPSFAYLPESETHNLRAGTLVKVRLSRKPGGRGETRAELLGSLGSLKDPLHDLDNLCLLYGFASEFAPETLEEAETLPDDPSSESRKGRIDLRELPVITIDPKDAKDHDDAVSVELFDGGLVRLGVHIADVSHYVRPGTALDREAQDRATSVYLPGRTIPMLPEKLSAGLCSLMDGLDRLAKSCFITYDAAGAVVRREVVNSVIRVRKYLTYEQVLPVLKGAGNSGDQTVDWLLTEGRNLADKLLGIRMENGSLVLEIPRPHVIVGKNGLAQSVEPEVHDIAHNLIEEFMLAANQAVAAFLIERGLPYIGRVHPAPDQEDKEAFWEFCDELRVARPDFEEPGSLQRMLDKVEGREGGDAIHLALLRSMKRAVYAPEPQLHYALQMTRYVHFTSPIRRYPDTVVHQILDDYLATGARLRWESRHLDLPWADGSDFDATGNPPRDGHKLPRSQAWELLMPGIATHCTDRAIRADMGEIAANQIKILRTLLGREGDEIEGTVIAVTSRNIIVRLDNVMAEGQVDYRDLSDGWVENHKYWAIYETPEGSARIMMGDRVWVQIDGVDLSSRTLKLIPLGEHEKAYTRGRRGPSTSLRAGGRGGYGGKPPSWQGHNRKGKRKKRR